MRAAVGAVKIDPRSGTTCHRARGRWGAVLLRAIVVKGLGVAETQGFEPSIRLWSV